MAKKNKTEISPATGPLDTKSPVKSPVNVRVLSKRRTRNTIGRFHPGRVLVRGASLNYHGPDGSSGWVYVIQVGEACKVGITKDVRKRIATLSTASPIRPKLVLARRVQSLEYAKIAEQEAHYALKRYHIRGEWFGADAIRVANLVSFISASVRVLHFQHWGTKRKRTFAEMAGEPVANLRRSSSHQRAR